MGPKFQVDATLCDFEGDDGISSPSFTYASALDTSIFMDTPDNVPLGSNPYTHLAFLRELKENQEYESDASVHYHRMTIMTMRIV